MKVVVDHISVREFGRRGGFHPNQVRFYYQVAGYGCLVLRCDEIPFDEWVGKNGIALFNFDTVDGRLICQEFPSAPASWADSDLIQVTIMPDRRKTRGITAQLSKALIEMIGREC